MRRESWHPDLDSHPQHDPHVLGGQNVGLAGFADAGADRRPDHLYHAVGQSVRVARQGGARGDSGSAGAGYWRAVSGFLVLRTQLKIPREKSFSSSCSSSTSTTVCSVRMTMRMTMRRRSGSFQTGCKPILV